MANLLSFSLLTSGNNGGIGSAENVTLPALVERLNTGQAQLSRVVNDYLSASGPTTKRPAAGIFIGQKYFDTTLGAPYFWNGTAWVTPGGGHTTGSVYLPTTIGLLDFAALTWNNQNGSSFTKNANGPTNIVFNTFSNLNNATLLGQAPPTAPWTATAHIQSGAGVGVNYTALGLGIVLNSGWYIMLGETWGNAMQVLQASGLNSNASITGDGAELWAHTGKSYFVRIYDDGTNYNFQYSVNGAQWHQLYSTTVAAAGPTTQVGLFANLNNTGNIPIVTADIYGLEIASGTGTNTTWNPRL